MENEQASPVPETQPLHRRLRYGWFLQLAGYAGAVGVGIITTAHNIRDTFYEIAVKWPGIAGHKLERDRALDVLITDAQRAATPADNAALYAAREEIFNRYHTNFNNELKLLGFEAGGLASPKGLLQRWRVIGQGKRHSIVFASIVSTAAAAGTITIAGLVHHMFEKLNDMHGTIDDNSSMHAAQETKPAESAISFREREAIRSADAEAQPTSTQR
jgi:hypothetical protein